MGVLKPPHRGWEHVPRGAEPSPGQAVPCPATSGCPAANLALLLPCRRHYPSSPPTGTCAQRGVPLSTRFPRRFLCGTVNDFVAEVGRAYKRAMENKQEAELMARKVGFGGAGWHSPQPWRGRVCSAGPCPGCACTGVHCARGALRVTSRVWSSQQR